MLLFNKINSEHCVQTFAKGDEIVYLHPNSRTFELAVDDIDEDVTENVNTKLIGFIQIQACDFYVKEMLCLDYMYTLI